MLRLVKEVFKIFVWTPIKEENPGCNYGNIRKSMEGLM